RCPSMFFQRKLPVSFSSCITLSDGEIMTVTSSISLQASAGFFCQKTDGLVVIREEPPKTLDPCETPVRNRKSSPPPGREFSAGAGWLRPRARKTKHSVG